MRNNTIKVQKNGYVANTAVFRFEKVFTRFAVVLLSLFSSVGDDRTSVF